MRKKYKYLVDEDDVAEHGPIFFNCIQEYYARLQKISILIPGSETIMEMFGISDKLGVLPGKFLAYEKSLLLNEDFKVGTIFHLCLSNVCLVNLSWESFLAMKSIIEKLISDDRREDEEVMSADSSVLNIFGVNPTILPKGFLLKASQADEYVKACKLIVLCSKEIDSCDLFKTYDEYFEYMLDVVNKIIKKCHDSFFYGTHEEKRFACILISLRNGLPMLDSIYKGIDNRFRNVPFEIPTDRIVKIQKEILFDSSGLHYEDDN